MKLLDRVRDVGLRRHLARVTIECYQMWIEQFLRFCRLDGRWREPRDLGAREVEAPRLGPVRLPSVVPHLGSPAARRMSAVTYCLWASTPCRSAMRRCRQGPRCCLSERAGCR